MCINCAPVALGIIGVMVKNAHAVLEAERAAVGLSVAQSYHQLLDPVFELLAIYWTALLPSASSYWAPVSLSLKGVYFSSSLQAWMHSNVMGGITQ